MTHTTKSTSSIHLNPGATIGERFRVEQWDATDPDWPVVAVDLLHDLQQVQLAVHPVGPWTPDSGVTEHWDAPWPQPSPNILLPSIDSPSLRHGGGVLAVSATPCFPCARQGLEEGDRGAKPELCNPITDAPEGVRQQLAQLRQLHRLSMAVADLHQSHHAHSALTPSDFRRDGDGRVRLRPSPGWRRPDTTRQLARDGDLASLQRMACVIIGRGLLRPDSALHNDDGVQAADHLRIRVRSVLHRRYRNATDHSTSAQWRLALDRLICEYEAAWITEDARQSRCDVIDSLTHGDLGHALFLAESGTDPWCGEMRHRLAHQMGQAQDDYAAWLDQYRDESLLDASEQLIDLLSRGFQLPASSPVAPMTRRLSNSTYHLQAAAAAIRSGSWRQAHDALIAASSLDPANPTLATLAALLPGSPTHETNAS